MAMTGAFYPAVDLSAGEKERGTLETLLVAPVGSSQMLSTVASLLDLRLRRSPRALLESLRLRRPQIGASAGVRGNSSRAAVSVLCWDSPAAACIAY